MNIGIIGTASIAETRFIPAIKNYKNANYYGVDSRTEERAKSFSDKNGDKAFSSYEELLS